MLPGRLSRCKCAATALSTGNRAKSAIQVQTPNPTAATPLPANSDLAPSVTLIVAIAAQISAASHPQLGFAGPRKTTGVIRRKPVVVAHRHALPMLWHLTVRGVPHSLLEETNLVFQARAADLAMTPVPVGGVHPSPVSG